MFNNTEKQILYRLFKEPTSRVVLANNLRITSAAITQHTNALLEKNVIKEKGLDESSSVGRKKVLLEINRDFCYVIGIAIEVDFFEVALSNSTGTVLQYHKEYMALENIYEYLQANFQKIFDTLLANTNIDQTHLLGAGIIHVGSKKERNLIENIVKLLESFFYRINIKVKTGNNVHSIAVAEYMLNEFEDNFFCIKYGPRIGSALWLQGSLYKGYHNIAGEIAHLVVPKRKRKTEKCSVCGRMGCLESLISIDAIRKQIKQIENYHTRFSFLFKEKTLEELTLYDIFSCATKDTLLLKIRDEVCFYLAQIIVLIEEIIDCKKIILFGESFLLEDFFNSVYTQGRKLGLIINSKELSGLEVVNSKSPPDKKVIGGIFLILGDLMYFGT